MEGLWGECGPGAAMIMLTRFTFRPLGIGVVSYISKTHGSVCP